MADQNTSLPIRTETAGDVAVKVTDGTVTSQQLSVDSGGRVTAKLADGSGNAVTSQTSGSQRALDVGINVSGVQVDPRSIRALTSSDVVTAAQGTAASTAAAWPVKISDGVDLAVVSAAGELSVQVTQPLPTGTNVIGAVHARLNDATGTAFSSGNPLPVSVAASAGTKVTDYNTASSLAAAASSNHNYAITNLKTFNLSNIWASASGKLKIEVQVSTDGSAFTTKFVGFNSTANPNISIDIDNLSQTNAGGTAVIRVIRTNLDIAAQNVYSTISGLEVS